MTITTDDAKQNLQSNHRRRGKFHGIGVPTALPAYLRNIQEYQRVIFYDVDDLPFETKTKILRNLMELDRKRFLRYE